MATKSKPTSIRLSRATEELVREQARRTKRTRSAVLRVAADEGIRQRAFPGIGFRGEDAARRAWIIGTHLDVWEVIAAYADFGRSVERLTAETDLDQRQVRLAVAYAERFPEEIEAAIAENERVEATYSDRFPSFEAPG